MNEVTVLSTAGELAGRAAGHGVQLARRAVVATTRSATTLGVVAGRASSRAAAEAVRARRARAVRLPSPDAVRRDLAAVIAPARRRRWPWAVGVLGVLAAAAVVALQRRPVAAAPAPAPPRVEDVRTDAVTATDPGLTAPER